jgi:predicted DNA-binding transcriptional regulator YafY
MSVNKNALIRYKVMDSCFRNHAKKYFIEDLIDECSNVLAELNSSTNGISRRQIFQDILFMESSEGWSIELEKNRVGKRIFYRYVDPKFSINNMPLNELEISHLKSAIDILSQFKGMPQFEWMNETLPKLQHGTAKDSSKKTIIEFDSNQYLKGIENIGELYNAILYKKVLLIKYLPFEAANAFDIIIHPYYLKQYNNRWFLYGYNPSKNKYDWNLALDRIKNISELNEQYHINDTIDWQDYFEDLIGVTKPENTKVENVVLLFKGKTGHYIESKPIHGSQKLKRIDSETVEVNLNVIINYELERLILSYADSVEVLKPKSLVDSIIEKTKSTLSQYK